MQLTRRQFTLFSTSTLLLAASGSQAQQRLIWSADETWAALQDDTVRLVDIRSREEWRETGVAQMAWPISMHERNFPKRLFAAKDMAQSRPIALICATGGRTGSVMRALRQSGITGYVDVSEGMMGSRRGRGWIAKGLPIVTADAALTALPARLR